VCAESKLRRWCGNSRGIGECGSSAITPGIRACACGDCPHMPPFLRHHVLSPLGLLCHAMTCSIALGIVAEMDGGREAQKTRLPLADRKDKTFIPAGESLRWTPRTWSPRRVFRSPSLTPRQPPSWVTKVRFDDHESWSSKVSLLVVWASDSLSLPLPLDVELSPRGA
jgi:hypothetical protein